MVKILVVDDEDDIRESMRIALESWGYEVVTARDGKEGLRKLGKEKVDLVLLDFFMPEMSGREVLAKIRADQKLKKTKVAMITIARMSEAGAAELKRLGVADYITKPVDLPNLKERIKKIVGG